MPPKRVFSTTQWDYIPQKPHTVYLKNTPISPQTPKLYMHGIGKPMTTNPNTGVAVAAVRKAQTNRLSSLISCHGPVTSATRELEKRADTHAPKGFRTFAKETTPGRNGSNNGRRTNSTKGLQD